MVKKFVLSMKMVSMHDCILCFNYTHVQYAYGILFLGAVIVGSVEGSRIWGKELKKLMLTGVQWSPNSKFLLFTIKTGEAHLYDSDGNFIVSITLQ